VEAVETVRAATGRLPLVAIEPPPRTSPLGLARAAVARLDERGLAAPILLVDSSSVAGDPNALLEGACHLGGLLVDGIGDAVRVDGAADDRALARAFGVLQATRLRMSRPDYISCPSCGRTLFDLEETTARVKRVTSHLRGVKIAIMGCIVNGPGEMADADFGYVGSSPGKVNLYVRRDCIVKNVPAAEAPERLVELIKEHGRWTEPAEATG